MRFFRLSPILALISLVAACGGSGGSAPSLPPVQTVVSISLSPTSPSLVVGESMALQAIPMSASGTPVQGQNIQWLSLAATVATVTSSGIVTGVQAGQAPIRASVGSVSRETIVIVSDTEPSPGTVATVEISPTAITLEEGNSHQFGATPRDASGQPLTGRGIGWSVLDPDVAFVEPGGRVTALKSGTTRIDVTVEGKMASSILKVEAFYPYSLIFSRDVAVANMQLYTLDIKDPAASEIPIVLPGSANLDPSASPDGTRIAFVALTPTETYVYIANRNGSGPARLTTLAGRFDQPAWSPDGSKIAFRGRLPNQDSDIWVMSLDHTSTLSVTTSHGPTNQSSPAWSPRLADGSYRIVYSHSEGGLGHLWTMRADGSDKRQITSSSQNYDDMPSWSPDGDTIAFIRSGPAIFGDIYVVEATGGAGRLLTQLIGPLPGPQLEPSWSPDGKLIAFASSHADTHYQIYTVWADGTRVVRRTSEASNHASPNWIVP